MARQMPKGRLNKRGMLDIMEEKFIEEGKKRGPGTYTASQTGAKQLAARREGFRQMKEIQDAAMGGTQDFEDVIKGKKRY